MLHISHCTKCGELPSGSPMRARDHFLTSKQKGWFHWYECGCRDEDDYLRGVRGYGLFLWLARWRARRGWNKLNSDSVTDL